MRKLNDMVIEPVNPVRSGDEPMIGHRLSELRKLAGLSQTELAVRMQVGQTAVSRLEKRTDVQLSTLRCYVEALGAQLRVGAAFDMSAATELYVLDIFDEQDCDENQLVLPIFSDDELRSRRDFVLSIKPKFSSLILTGRKKVELRRRFPSKISKDALAFIYSTSPEKAMIGTARISSVEQKSIEKIWSHHSEDACIDKGDFDAYFSGLRDGFVLKFGDVRPLRRNIGLEELRQRFGFEPPQSFLYAKPLLRRALAHEHSEIPH